MSEHEQERHTSRELVIQEDEDRGALSPNVSDPEDYTIARATLDNIRAQPLRHLILAGLTMTVLFYLDPGDRTFYLAYATVILLIACALAVYGGAARQSDLEDEFNLENLEQTVKSLAPRESAHMAAANFRKQPTSALLKPVFNLYQVPILLGIIFNVVPLLAVFVTAELEGIVTCTAISVGFHTLIFASLLFKERVFPRDRIRREVIARERLRIIAQVGDLESSKGGVTLAVNEEDEELVGSLTMSDEKGALTQVDSDPS